MYPISDALKQLFLDGNKKCCKLTLNNATTENLVITETDILSDSLTIDRYCSSGNKIEVGSAIAAELTLTLLNNNDKFSSITFEGADVGVEIGFSDVENSFIPCGKFTVDEPPRNSSHIKLKALDYMMRFDRKVDFTKISFPTSVKNLLVGICGLCEVDISPEINLDSLPNIDQAVKAPSSTDLIYRQLLQWIAQLTGTCAFMDWEGKLRLSWFASSSVTLDPTNRYIGGSVDENDITITGVTIKSQNSTVTSGNSTYPLVIENNQLLYSEEEKYLQSIADNIFNSVGTLTYRPFKCNAIPMPFLYPLDIVSYRETNGNVVQTVITNHNFGVNIASALSAVGETATQSGYSSAKGLTKNEVDAAIKEALKDVDAKAEHVHLKYSPYENGVDANGNASMTDKPTADTEYLGVCATNSTEAPNTPSSYKWAKIRGADGTNGKDGKDGQDGENGKDGQDGNDGRGVSKVETEYRLSTSDTSLSSGYTWGTDAPTWQDGLFLWTRLVTYYTDGTNTPSDPVVDASWKKTSVVDAASKELNETLANALGLYVTEVIVSDTKVRYYHSKSPLASCVAGDKILVFNANGFGVCTTGWNGGSPQFSYGATFDGKAVWDILVANNISADNIVAGVIKSVASAAVQTKLNLNDGTMSFESDNTSVEIKGAETTSDNVVTPAGLLIRSLIEDFWMVLSTKGLACFTYEQALAEFRYAVSPNNYPKPVDPYHSVLGLDSLKTKDIHCQNIYVLNEGVEENLVDALTTVGSQVVYHDEALAALQEKYTALEEALGQQHEHSAATAVKENIVAPTCTNAGSYDSVVYCATCGEEISRQTITTEATGHDYTSVVTPPTETAQGYTTYTCKNCGDSYKSNYTDTVKYFTAKISSSGANSSDSVYISGDANGSTNYGSQKSSSTIGETIYYFAKAGSGRVISKIVTSDGQIIPAKDLETVNALTENRTKLAYPTQVISAWLGKTAEITVYFEAVSSGELTIVAGETKSVDINAGEITYLKFTPSISGTYEFTSLGTKDDDVVGYLYDANKSQITTDDDTAGDRQFLIAQELTANTTYYWGVKYWSTSKTGSVNVKLTYNGSGGSSGGGTGESVAMSIGSGGNGTVNVVHNGVDVTNSSSYTYNFNVGDTVTVSATANSGYSFMRWYNPNTSTYLSAENPYTFTVSSDITQVIAIFV